MVDGGGTPDARTPAGDPDLVSAALAVVLPDEPLPVRLINTIWADRSGVHDALTTVENLHAWLVAVDPDPVGRAVDPSDLDRFRRLRDALRRLAALVTDDTRPGTEAPADIDQAEINQAVADVNLATAQAPNWPRLVHRDDGLHVAAGGHPSAARRALATIAHDSVELFAARPVSLRACYAPGCVRYFVKDHHRREWCSTACGNRARAARHYQRHHKSSPEGTPPAG